MDTHVIFASITRALMVSLAKFSTVFKTTLQTFSLKRSSQKTSLFSKLVIDTIN